VAVPVGRGAGDDNALRADHLAHDAAARVGRAHEDRADANLLGGDLLQTAEKDVGRGVRARDGRAEPPEKRAEEGIKRAAMGEGEAERAVGARIARTPEPMAERMWNLKTALIGAAFATSTGGIRRTALCNPGMLISAAKILSSRAWNWGTPQTRMKRVRTHHGNQAWKTSRRDSPDWAAVPESRAGTSLPSAKRRISLGRQIRSSAMSEAMQHRPATGAASHGP